MRIRIALCSLAAAAASITPAPAQEPYLVTVALSGSGGGRVTSDPPGIDCTGICQGFFTPGTIVTLSNDRVVHGMAAGGAAGGMWPAGWTPGAMNAPAQWRPMVVDFGAPAIDGASVVAFAGCQDGRVYAFDAETGERLWQSPAPPVLGEAVQASPGGVLRAFGGPFDLLLVGTRDPRTSALEALDLDGQRVWRFTSSEEIGIISSQVAVAAAEQRVWFTSRRHPTGAQDTVWCLDFTETGATRRWARALGDIDAAPNVRGGVVYVGTVAGEVHAPDADGGTDRWSSPWDPDDGAVKVTVWVDSSASEPRLVFSTDTAVHAVRGTSAAPVWSTRLPNPSAPVVSGGSVYVGTTRNNGELVRIDLGTGAELRAVGLADPNVAKTPGRPSFEGSTNQVLIGSEDGVVYAVDAGF